MVKVGSRALNCHWDFWLLSDPRQARSPYISSQRKSFRNLEERKIYKEELEPKAYFNETPHVAEVNPRKSSRISGRGQAWLEEGFPEGRSGHSVCSILAQ